jgi:hypothetical protein
METVIGIEDNDDGKLEGSGVDRSSSALFSPKQISNPVVYKLVRVYISLLIDSVCQCDLDFFFFNLVLCALCMEEVSNYFV